MPARIKIAETTTELEDLFAARHKVFVEEEGYLASKKNGRIVDQFDAFPNTTNIIAQMDGQVVGGIRLTNCSSAGIPSDHFYNFSPFFQDTPTKVAGVSQFFLRKQQRANNYRIGIALMGMCAYWATKQNLTHLVAAVNPVISPLLKLVGMKPVAPKFFHDGEGVNVLPMIMDMKQLREPLVSMVKRQRHHNCPENFDREYYLANEPVDCCSQHTERDYVVINGKVSVHDHHAAKNNMQQEPLFELGPGKSLRDFGLFSPHASNVHVSAGAKTELMVTEKTDTSRSVTERFEYPPAGNFHNWEAASAPIVH